MHIIIIIIIIIIIKISYLYKCWIHKAESSKELMACGTWRDGRRIYRLHT